MTSASSDLQLIVCKTDPARCFANNLQIDPSEASVLAGVTQTFAVEVVGSDGLVNKSVSMSLQVQASAEGPFLFPNDGLTAINEGTATFQIRSFLADTFQLDFIGSSFEYDPVNITIRAGMNCRFQVMAGLTYMT